MKNKWSCCVKRIVHEPSFLRVIVPILIVVMTVFFGWASGFDGGKPAQAAWNSIGHLIGETSFDDVNLADIVGISFFNKLSRVFGLLLLPYAFFLVVHEQYRNLLVKARVWLWCKRGKPYVVVFGLGWKGYELVKNILLDEKNSLRVVGVDLLNDDDQITELCSLGMAFFKGNATSKDVQKRCGVLHAEKGFVLTGKDELNCRIAMKLADLFSEDAAPVDDKLSCYVSVDDQRQRDFIEDFAAKQNNKLYIHCFNLYEQAALEIIRERGLVSGAKQHVHCVVVGNSPVAKSILLQCLRMLHLHEDQKRIITVICENKDEYRDTLYAEYSCLNTVETSLEMMRAKEGVFPEIRFVELPLSNNGWLEDGFELYDHMEEGWRINLYMCVDDGIKSLSLMELVYKRLVSAEGKLNANCYHNYPETGLDNPKTEWAEFGDYEQTCKVGYLQRAACDPAALHIFKKYPDLKGRSWLEIRRWERESNRQAADHSFVKFSLLGLNPDSSSSGKLKEMLAAAENMDWLSRVEHRRWSAERLLGGWRPLTKAADKQAWLMSLKKVKEGDDGTSAEDVAAIKGAKEMVSTLKHDFLMHFDLQPYSELETKEQEKDSEVVAALMDIAMELGCVEVRGNGSA